MRSDERAQQTHQGCVGSNAGPRSVCRLAQWVENLAQSMDGRWPMVKWPAGEEKRGDSSQLMR
jgi:hypothetical protein